VVHASAFALSREPCRSAVLRAFRLAQDQGKIISLDPNYSPVIWPDRSEARRVLAEILSIASITKPSLDDAARLWGKGKSPQEYARIFHDLGPRQVVLTMGEDGVLISQDGDLTHIPRRPVEVADTTGAGDSFWAGFITAMLDGEPLRRCGLFAREIAERKLTTVGPLAGKLDRQGIYAALGD
jgi:fructokinase